MTAPDPAKVAEYADKIMVWIRSDMAGGRVPRNVGSFSKLHDYCDANVYTIDALGADFVVVEHYGDEDAAGNRLDDATLAALDAETAMGNAVVEEVDRRLRADAEAADWCETCGNPVGGDVRQCGCWCLLADALQRFLGMGFDEAADRAARMWAEEADKVRVWTAEYANDHDVPAYPKPKPEGEQL